MNQPTTTPASRYSWLRRHWPQLVLAALLLFGFGLRMIDLTDPPLDFHPTRQFRGALIARSLYYQLSPSEDAERQQIALSMRERVAELEPPILESLVALGYLIAGSEQLWIARIFTSLAWALGGWALYALARRVTGEVPALIALAYYLVLPFGVVASRSFQPDPLMVALIAFCAYAAYLWSEQRTWKWALWASLSAGLAILIKALAVYFLAGMLMAVVLASLGARQALRDRQVWAMVAISLLPAVIYYLVLGDSSGAYVQDWIVALLPLAADPGFYVRWLSFVSRFVGLGAILAGLAGISLARGVYRLMLVGLWLGYLAYGISLPHQTTTHDYYHLLLVWLLALSMAPVLQVVVDALRGQTAAWRLFFAAVVLAGIAYPAWVARSTLVAQNYQADEVYWSRVGDAIPEDGDTIALTQYYGHLLAYYGWRNVSLWPEPAEVNLAALRGASVEDFEVEFESRAVDMDYFLVTASSFLDAQPLLKERLNNYPLYAEGDGYIIYDLRP